MQIKEIANTLNASILTPEIKGIPSAKYKRQEAVISVERASNAPLSKSTWMMGRLRIIRPIAAGKVMKAMVFMEKFNISLNVSKRDLLLNLMDMMLQELNCFWSN